MGRSRPSVLLWMSLAVALLAVSCGIGSGGGREGTNDPMRIEGELVRTDGFRIPPNPVTGDATPEPFQQGLFWRYRLHVGEPVRAIVVLVPGGSAGANNFDYMARELIRMSRGAVEVWAFERRPNLLEDLTGMEAAEAAGDPQLAVDYYYRSRPVDGRTFAGFLRQDEVSYLSEWGLECVMRDIEAAIHLVPEAKRSTNVILGGHSLGVAQVLHFLGWDFDGSERTLQDAGYNQVAGAILLDAPIVAAPSRVSREEYLGKVETLRSGSADRYAGFLPMLTPEVLAFGEMIGMAAHPRFDDPGDPLDGPKGTSRFKEIPFGPDVEAFLNRVFSNGFLDGMLHIPPTFRDFNVTNEALLGLLFDDNFQPVTPVHLSVGFPSPADRTKRRGLPSIPLLLTPGYTLTDPSITYGWRNYDEVDGIEQTTPDEEVTDITRLSEALWRGPTNFLEWYFATRPLADQSAIGSLANLSQDSWQAADFGLNLFHTSKVDVPILAIGARGGMAPDPAWFAGIRKALAPVTRDGTPRSSEDAFRIRMVDGYGHFDVLLADNDRSGGNRVFGEILDFVLQHAEGKVTVP